MPRASGRLCAVSIVLALTACSNGVPLGPSEAATSQANGTPGAAPTSTPTPTPPPAAPVPPPTTPAAAVAYTPDLAPIFAADCTPCHGSRSAAGRYSTTTYAGVMAAVRAGSASSALVIVTQPGGIMYPFFSGDRATKAALIRTWVLNGAPQSR